MDSKDVTKKRKKGKDKKTRFENEDRERNDKVATRSRHFYADIQHRRTVERSNKLFSKVSTTSFGVAEGPTGTRNGGEEGWQVQKTPVGIVET